MVWSQWSILRVKRKSIMNHVYAIGGLGATDCDKPVDPKGLCGRLELACEM